MSGLFENIFGRSATGFKDALRDVALAQFIEVIEWDGGENTAQNDKTQADTRDTLMWKFPDLGNEIKNGAQLTVREGQMAVLLNEGNFADVFTAGRHELSTANLPVLTTMRAWKTDFVSPFKVDVFFVNTRLFTNIRWATPKPIMVADPQFKRVRISAEGSYNLQITDPKLFFSTIASVRQLLTLSEIQEGISSTLISHLIGVLAAQKISVVDLSTQYVNLNQQVLDALAPEIAQYGMVVPRFIVENVTLPPEVETFLDKMSQIEMADGNLNNYMKLQTANAIETAAEHSGSGGLAGLGMGVMMLNQSMGGMMGGMGGMGGVGGYAPERADAALFKRTLDDLAEYKRLINAPFWNPTVPAMSGNVGNEAIGVFVRLQLLMAQSMLKQQEDPSYQWGMSPEYTDATNQFTQLMQVTMQQAVGEDGEKIGKFMTAFGEKMTEFSAEHSRIVMRKYEEKTAKEHTENLVAAQAIAKPVLSEREQIMQSLKDLGELKVAGVLSEAEFEEQKTAALAKLKTL